jgi:glutaminyl-peptide cyclotransferase
MAQKSSLPVARPTRRRWLGAALLGSAAVAGGAWYVLRPRPPSPARENVQVFEVVNSFPHDPGAFTQGLAFDQGELFEGTGQEGESVLRRVELKTGRVLQEHPLEADLFGEGITVLDDEIFQLTWKDHRAFVYDRRTFQVKRTYRYDGEGWGLTHDGKLLIMSDGSDRLHFRDPATFELVRRVKVRDAGRPVRQINELEFINGEVYANVWETDYIVRIAPGTGKVASWIDLKGLLPESERTGEEDFLNGIAYDRDGRRLFVTGKYWPRLFEIKVVDRS